MRTTSHNHSPKQAQASDTKEQENQQTRQKASCIARGENQFPAVCIISLQLFAIIAHRMHGQKQRYETDIKAHTSSAWLEKRAQSLI